MDHSDHLSLIREGIHPSDGVWAELGSGRGAFTLALAELLGPGGVIYSVDRNRGALHAQERAVRQRNPLVELHLLHADFTKPLELPTLDGVLMANSLHFQRDRLSVLRSVRATLRPGGRLVIVEYNLTRGNFAVPYPVPYTDFVELAEEAGYVSTRMLATRPSSTMGEIYAALSLNSDT